MKIFLKFERVAKGILFHQILNKFTWYFIGFFIISFINENYRFIIMAILNGLCSLIIINIYDKMKIDWVYIEALKISIKKREKLEKNNGNSITRKIEFLSSKGYLLLITGLIIWDSTISILFLRKGSYRYDKFKDKKIILYYLLSILLSSIIPYTIISNMYN